MWFVTGVGPGFRRVAHASPARHRRFTEWEQASGMMRRTPRERARVSTQQSDPTDNVRSPLRPALRSRPARPLRPAVADVRRAPRGIEPLGRHAFSRLLAVWGA